MLPGNTKEDEMWDAFWEEFWFHDALFEWAEEHNPILCFAMSEISLSQIKADRWAKSIIEEYEEELPIDRWFEEWRE